MEHALHPEGSTFASGSGLSSETLLRQAVYRSGTAPPGLRENSVKTPLIYIEGKKRENLTRKIKLFCTDRISSVPTFYDCDWAFPLCSWRKWLYVL